YHLHFHSFPTRRSSDLAQSISKPLVEVCIFVAAKHYGPMDVERRTQAHQEEIGAIIAALLFPRFTLPRSFAPLKFGIPNAYAWLGVRHCCVNAKSSPDTSENLRRKQNEQPRLGSEPA